MAGGRLINLFTAAMPLNMAKYHRPVVQI
jgi:hypothetical protein